MKTDRKERAMTDERTALLAMAYPDAFQAGHDAATAAQAERVRELEAEIARLREAETILSERLMTYGKGLTERDDEIAKLREALRRIQLTPTLKPTSTGLRPETSPAKPLEPTMTDIEREHATLIAFVAGIARLPLSTPAGMNAQQCHANRLRKVRRAARHIIEHQFDDAEKAIADLLAEGRVELRDGKIALNGADHED